MAGEAAYSVDPEFPNLDPEVVKGYREAPPHMTAEVLEGSLVVMPRPRRRHNHAAGKLSGRLRGFYDPDGDEPGGWVLHGEPELHLGRGPDIVVPDLAGWRRARLSEGFLDENDGGGIALPPDWLCEVQSPSTRRYDRGAKMRIYHREGVGHLWYVEPSLRTLEVFEHSAAGYVLRETFEGDDLVRAAPFDAIEIPLARLWEI